MNYWLVKSEPEDYSFEDLQEDGKAMWDGVRNYAARNNLRKMAKGDLVLFYHSKQGLEVVGIARVCRESYPDPTEEREDWSVVDLEPVKPLQQSVTLKAIKAEPELADIALVKNSRLSVMPLPEAAFAKIRDMGGA
jgi:predicted RNA-binding protein with PUA-like domain